MISVRIRRKFYLSDLESSNAMTGAATSTWQNCLVLKATLSLNSKPVSCRIDLPCAVT